jgi:hypothetical protein
MRLWLVRYIEYVEVGNVREKPCLIVRDSHAYTGKSAASLLVRLSIRMPHATDRNCTFFRGKAFRGVGIIG